MLNVAEIMAKMDALTRQVEDQNHRIENQNHQIEVLTQELHFTKTTFYANVLIQDKDNQTFIALTNSLVESLLQHEGP